MLPNVIDRTAFLALLSLLGAFVAWKALSAGHVLATLIAAAASLPLGLFITVSRNPNPGLAVPYAILQGLLLGSAALFVERLLPGIGMLAIGLPFVCFALMLVLYRVRVFEATPGPVKVLATTLLVVATCYAVAFVLVVLGQAAPFPHEFKLVTAGIGLLLISIAAAFFASDFLEMEIAVREGVSEEDAWRLAFALLTGQLWLYVGFPFLLKRR